MSLADGEQDELPRCTVVPGVFDGIYVRNLIHRSAQGAVGTKRSKAAGLLQSTESPVGVHSLGILAPTVDVH